MPLRFACGIRWFPGALAGLALLLLASASRAEPTATPSAEPAKPEPAPAPAESAQPKAAPASPSQPPAPGYYYPPPGYYYPPPGYYYPPPGYYYPPPGYPPPAYPPPGSPAPPAAGTANATVAAERALPAPEPVRSYSVGGTLTTSLDTESGSDSFLTAPLVQGAYAVHRRVFLDLVAGFGWLVDNQGLGESTLRVANPQLTGTYHDRVDAWELRGSLGVTAPVAHVPLGVNGRLYRSVYNRALAAWGMWNQWLWYADRMAVPVTLRAAHRFSGGQRLAAELAPALVVGARHDASGTELVGQLGLGVELPLGARFILCPRLQAVLLPSTSIDRLQTAAELRGVLATKVGRFFAAVLVNLDEPLRSVGGGQRWGLHLGKEMDL